jgi:hypothetical protein
MPKTVTTKAKRQAIAKAYGCNPAETDMDDFYYARRQLAKLDQADERGFHHLRYHDERNGHGGAVTVCLLSRAKRKTSTRDEYFAF